MKILTAAQMRAVDQATIEAGIPGLVLMENAAHRVVEAMRAHFAPLCDHRILVFCGKGNNGGDGLAIARILFLTERPRQLDVVLADDDLSPDARANLAMFRVATGGEPARDIQPQHRHATLIVDALLGTGATGGARGRAAEFIAEINGGFPHAKVVAVDLPSGMGSDEAATTGLQARADLTVTFTALKPAHALPPNCDRQGRLIVAPIGSPDWLLKESQLHQTATEDFAHLLGPRPRDAHKGSFGHALIIGGAPGKSGAAHLAGLAALRMGAGLVTVASSAPAGSLPPELMTEPLPGNIANKSVIAIGPGLGIDPVAAQLFHEAAQPLIADADALNTLAAQDFVAPAGPLRILTPHPGEMRRLDPASTGDRLEQALAFAQKRNVILVLKGQRTIIALPDGRAWINPTGTPAMATAGSGDILTGLIAGLVAQHPAPEAVLAAVWLHGRAGEHAAQALGESTVIATDILHYLPHALRDVHQP